MLMIDRAADVRFAVADERHDAGIRALLRETSMGGDIAISFQREPSYFAAARMEGGEHRAVAALDPASRVVCAGGVSIRPRYYNGETRRIGYLGQLRLARSHAGRFDVLRRGYRFFRALHASLDVDAYFTSIAADNTRAIRLLERGLPGFPRYEPVGELATLLLPTSPHLFRGCSLSSDARAYFRSIGLRLDHDTGPDLGRLAHLLDGHAASFQFAPAWDAAGLARLLAGGTLRGGGFRLLSDAAGPVACAALWDQRPFKQAVVAGYSRRLALLRPLYNAFAVVSGRVPLPPPGGAAPQAFISHVAVPTDRPEWLAELLALLTATARTLGITMMALGLDARDPRLPHLVRRFRPRLYRTRLYTVSWEDEPPRVGPPDGRLVYPEVALL